MAPAKTPPMVDYTIKMMLLEAVKCYRDGNYTGLKWVENQMFIFNNRLRELQRRD